MYSFLISLALIPRPCLLRLSSAPAAFFATPVLCWIAFLKYNFGPQYMPNCFIGFVYFVPVLFPKPLACGV